MKERGEEGEGEGDGGGGWEGGGEGGGRGEEKEKALNTFALREEGESDIAKKNERRRKS